MVRSRHSYLQLLVLAWACLFSLESSAKIGFAVAGGYPYSKVDNGSDLSADNVGYSAQTSLSYFFDAFPLSVGAFYYRQMSKTYKVHDSANVVENFHISPVAYGLELGLWTEHFRLRGGYGLYTAEGRRVVEGIGRTYELTQGRGMHGAAEYLWRLSAAVSLASGVEIRKTAYGAIKIKGSSEEPIPIEQKWNQTTYGALVGILMHL